MQIVEKEFEGIRYSVVGSSNPQAPHVVFLHGYGANMHDLIPLATYGEFAARAGFRWLFLQAPLPVPISPYEQGWAWFELNMQELFNWSQTQDLDALAQWKPYGVQQITHRLESLVAHEVPPQSKLVVGGFSQGAILSLEWALGDSRKLNGLILLSCTWLDSDNWSRKISQGHLPPVFQSHGKMDPFCPLGRRCG